MQPTKFYVELRILRIQHIVSILNKAAVEKSPNRKNPLPYYCIDNNHLHHVDSLFSLKTFLVSP